MTGPLTAELLRKFLLLAARKLKGDWLLVGGTVLPLLDLGYRSTTDIDIVPVGESSTAQTLALMEICEELGLPIETINSAAAYFVRKIPDYASHLVELARGKHARIFRPDAALFMRLKLKRMSETDLTDCLRMLKACRDELTAAERKRLISALDAEVGIGSSERSERIVRLKNELAKPGRKRRNHRP